MNERLPNGQRRTNTWRGVLVVGPAQQEMLRTGPFHALPYEIDQDPQPNEATVSAPRRAPRRRAPDDDVVAWELAVAARPHLSRVDADRIYIAIGVGDTFEAIDALLIAIARDRVPLDHDVVATVASWLDCYRGQDAEPRLRHLLAQIASSAPPVPAFEERFKAALIASQVRRSG